MVILVTTDRFPLIFQIFGREMVLFRSMYTGLCHVVMMPSMVPIHEPALVAEPAIIALLGIGLAGLADAKAGRRRKREQSIKTNQSIT